MPDPTRVCARCHIEKPLDTFPIKDKARGTRAYYCRPCRSDYGRQHYQQHRDDYLKRNVVARVRQRFSNRDLLDAYLLTHPCVDCGEADPVVLDFDHVDPAQKLWSVGAMVSRQAAPALQREIDKCVVRCANCHRMRTAKQFGSYRLKEATDAYRR